jgi:carbamoyltransferase
MFLLRQTTHRMLVRHDAEIGHRYVPDLKARVPHEAGGYFVRTNSQGFRSDSEFTQPKGHRPRLVFLGDSFTAGDGVDNLERFAELTGDQLDAEVYNYGLSGSGTDQHLLVYRKYASKVDADLVVLCVLVENIERIKVRYRESVDRTSGRRLLVPKPYFTLDEGRLELHHVPVPLARPPASEVPRDQFQSTMPKRLLPLYRLYAEHVRNRPERAEMHQRAARLYGKVKDLDVTVLKRQPHEDYTSRESPGWQLMEAIVRQIASEVAPKPLLLVPIPTAPYLDGVEPLYQRLFALALDGIPNAHLADLTSPLLALPREDRARLSFRTDPHFSPFGHRCVATALSEVIRQRRLLPLAAAPKPRPAKAAPTSTWTLGISAFYHDSAAAIVRDGEIVAAAQEERFSRVKNDRRFPSHAINYCLEEAGLRPGDLAAIAYYDNASQTFERILRTVLATREASRSLFMRALPSWLDHKLHIPRIIRDELSYGGLILQNDHHRSHAAAAFYPSPFERAAILTVDGVGEWATASIALGERNRIQILREMQFPNSLGLLYSAFTQFTGFKVNSGEYKMMGLAPYGRPLYVDTICEHLIDLKEDGSLGLKLERFGFLAGSSMTNERFAELFKGAARRPEDPIRQREMDIAASIQAVTEEAMLRMGRYAQQLTGANQLCLAGGVALNCVANGRLLREGPFSDLWIQPAAGDAGSAVGVALDVYHTFFGGPRQVRSDGRDTQKGSYLGPSYCDQEIRAFLETHGYPYRSVPATERAEVVARELASGNVVGHFAGRAEFGPRALGSRSILGDPRNPEMQVKLNLKIKYRESFRPFAPTVLLERVADFFELDRRSPYMLLVAPVRTERRLPFERGSGEDLLPIVRLARSDVPAITHVDYSARIQTVERADHPEYYDVLRAFEALTGCGVIVNTSFNVRGEPIVSSPYDAYRCFMRTEMDVLVLGNQLLVKADQPPWPEAKGHVESDDLSDVSTEGPSMKRELKRELQQIFERDILPLARSRGARALQTRYDAESTYWRKLDETDARRRFIVPSSLDRWPVDPHAMTSALLQYWEPGDITESLRPVVTRLLEACSDRRPERSLDEDVSSLVYVMF